MIGDRHLDQLDEGEAEEFDPGVGRDGRRDPSDDRPEHDRYENLDVERRIPGTTARHCFLPTRLDCCEFRPFNPLRAPIIDARAELGRAKIAPTLSCPRGQTRRKSSTVHSDQILQNKTLLLGLSGAAGSLDIRLRLPDGSSHDARVPHRPDWHHYLLASRWLARVSVFQKPSRSDHPAGHGRRCAPSPETRRSMTQGQFCDRPLRLRPETRR